MQLSLYGKHLELTDALRNYVQQRLDKLDRYFPGQHTAQVALSVQRERQTVEVTIPFEGLILRAQESEGSMYVAIDQVLDKLERQIHKFKTRVHRKQRHEWARATNDPEVPAEEPDGEELVRQKRFPLKPMTVDEAMLQLNLLGHDFFVFRDAATEEVVVLYRRKHGGYGLITGQ